jgi:hypothetical protein
MLLTIVLFLLLTYYLQYASYYSLISIVNIMYFIIEASVPIHECQQSGI